MRLCGIVPTGPPVRRHPDDLVAVDGAERPALADQGGRGRLVARTGAAFGGERDDRLLAVLSRLHEERSGEDIEVAVVCGAAHVPAIVRGLMDRYGYRPRSADWLTVADL